MPKHVHDEQTVIGSIGEESIPESRKEKQPSYRFVN